MVKSIERNSTSEDATKLAEEFANELTKARISKQGKSATLVKKGGEYSVVHSKGVDGPIVTRPDGSIDSTEEERLLQLSAVKNKKATLEADKRSKGQQTSLD